MSAADRADGFTTRPSGVLNILTPSFRGFSTWMESAVESQPTNTVSSPVRLNEGEWKKRKKSTIANSVTAVAK
jgi:hypothetical protein